jgi:MRG-binding protein
MPPKKKTKLSSRNASSTPQTEPGKQSGGTTGATESAQKSDTEYDLVNDPWTDEQETALLKGIVRWKPVGSSQSTFARRLRRR